MLKWRFLPKLGHPFIFWFIVVGVLSIIGLSAYHFLLFQAALKQQTLFSPGGSEFLLTSIDLLKTKMLLSILVVLGLAAAVLYGIKRKIVDPLGKLASATAVAAKTGDLTQPVEGDTRDEIETLSRSFQEMTNWMKETAGAFSSVAEGNSDPGMEVRSDQDTFGKVFQSMLASLKRTHETLRESEERFRGLATHAPIGLSTVKKGGEYEFVNPKFTEIFGYTLEDIPTGRNWFEKAYPDTEYRQKVVSCWREDVGAAKAGKTPAPGLRGHL